MIRHSLLTTQLRFFNENVTDPFAPYDAICTLTWETSTIVWMIGMHGEFSLKLFRELMTFMQAQGVLFIKAYRAPGHRLPFAESIGDNLYQIDINRVCEKINKKSA